MDDFFAEEEELFGREESEQKLEMEAKAFERVGPSGRLAEMLSSTDIQKKGSISPEDRFLISVDAISRRISSDGVIKLSETDINTMLEKTNLISGLRYKNPVAYILGYL